MRVLVVEDHTALRSLMCDLVELRGHGVTGVADAESAWNAYQEGGYSILLVDLTLPGVDGLELCRRIRARPGSEDPVIVVVTGRGRAGALADALVAGTDDFISKPLDLEEFAMRFAIAERQAGARLERLATQQELARSEARYRLLVELAPDLIYVLDGPRGTIADLSPASRR
jgi:DNA-binding response OmpR family regulator